MIHQGTDALESPRQLAQRLGMEFSDILLLSRSLTHRSYLNEHPEAIEDNERLEFLGDAVLDFLVGAWLYNRFPEMAEGQLTRLRSALVRTEQLAEFSKQLKLGKAMRLGRGEADSGGRHRLALLCATFEALVGAL
jgi:ribonuclease-3